MISFKKIGRSFLYTVGSIIIGTAFLTILYYFNIIQESTYQLGKLIVILLSILVNSIILGKQTKEKGYIEGCKLGSLLILFLFIPTVITSSFQGKTILYYIMILGTSIIGSMIGINQKKK